MELRLNKKLRNVMLFGVFATLLISCTPANNDSSISESITSIPTSESISMEHSTKPSVEPNSTNSNEGLSIDPNPNSEQWGSII